MCSHTVFELKKNSEGFLLLKENLSPYHALEEMGTRELRVILAIGGESKRACLHIPFGLHRQTQNHGVSLIPSLTHIDIVLLDCEMHLLRHDTINRLPDESLNNLNYHVLKNTRKRVCEIAYSLYHQIFLRFSDKVLVFVSDFGGIFGVIDLFSFWIGCSLETGYSPDYRSHINLVLEDRDLIDESTFWAELGSVMLTRLRRHGIVGVNLTHIIDFSRKCFEIELISQRDFLQRSWPDVIRSTRRQPFTDSLSTLQWKYLFRTAVAQYSQQPKKRFDMIAASRKLLPLPINAMENLNKFLETTKIRGKGLAAIVGSALVMNAFPQQMCWFPPDKIFATCYLNLLLGCERASGIYGLVNETKREFLRISTQNRQLEKSSAAAHAEAIYMEKGIHGLFIDKVCSFCLIGNSDQTLKCGHEFCNPCFILLGQEESTCRYRVRSCPLCGMSIDATATFKPPTSGRRVLNLQGYTGYNLWHFLKDLQQGAGLNSMPLKEHFDTIYATGTGSYFVISHFVNGVSLTDCKNISQNKKLLGKCKVIRKKGWSQFFSMRGTYQTSDVVVKSNTDGVEVYVTHENPTSITTPAKAADDITISYDGGFYTRKLLEILCNKLFSSLFYLELDALPTFYHGAYVCSINVLCRLPPGNALLDLLHRLLRRKICIYFQDKNMQPAKALLCSHKIVNRCRQNQPFMRRINVTARSRHAQISIRMDGMDGMDGKKYYLSNCPYRLSQLIKDQELECPFGSCRNQYVDVDRGIRADHNAVILLTEIDQLLDVIDFII